MAAPIGNQNALKHGNTSREARARAALDRLNAVMAEEVEKVQKLGRQIEKITASTKPSTKPKKVAKA